MTKPKRWSDRIANMLGRWRRPDPSTRRESTSRGSAESPRRWKVKRDGRTYSWKATQRPPWTVRAENRARNKRARRARRVNRARR